MNNLHCTLDDIQSPMTHGQSEQGFPIFLNHRAHFRINLYGRATYRLSFHFPGVATEHRFGTAELEYGMSNSLHITVYLFLQYSIVVICRP